MAFKRRRSSSAKKYAKRFRRSRKQSIRRAMVRYRTPIIHSFKRTLQLFETTLATNPMYGNFGFTLNDITTRAEWSNMFDSYMLKGVKLRFYYTLTSIDQSTPANGSGYLHTAIDWTDLNNFGSIDEAREYTTYRCTPLTRCNGIGGSRFLRPRVAQMLYRGVSTTGYGYSNKNLWIDMGSSDVIHYGLKYAIENGGNTQSKLRCVATYYFKCKMNK